MTPDPDERVSIQRGALELTLAPAVGGSVVSLRAGALDVLRPGSDSALAARDPRDLAAFPLVPFSGRIAGALFEYRSRTVRLRRNFPPEPHAIHGEGWQSAWRVEERSQHSVELVHDHVPDERRETWPWSYRATQRFTLGEHALELSMGLENRASEPMPAGLGWHPYFPKAGAVLRADVRRIWRSRADMIPAGADALDERCDLRVPRSVSLLDLDDAFSAGPGGSVIDWPDRGLHVELVASEALRHLVVFTPAGRDFFCVEPTSHSPDAVNSSSAPRVTGYREIAPGETLSAEIRIEIGSVRIESPPTKSPR